MPYFGRYFGGSAVSAPSGDAGPALGDANTEVDVFAIKQNDREPVLRRTLVEADGTPIDLTGKTVRFSMGTARGDVKVNKGLCTIVGDPTLGGVQYEWAEGDTDTADAYRGEFEIETLATGVTRTVPTRDWLKIKVYREIA